MTITHLSHFDLTEIGRTSTNVIFEGTMAACKRMAFAHGMEVESYEGPIIGFDECVAFIMPGTPDNFAVCFFVGGGLIMRGRDNYCLVMPLSVWGGVV